MVAHSFSAQTGKLVRARSAWELSFQVIGIANKMDSIASLCLSNRHLSLVSLVLMELMAPFKFVLLVPIDSLMLSARLPFVGDLVCSIASHAIVHWCHLNGNIGD
jgi:hypothetical protein